MNLLQTIAPKIAVVAPDGSELWIDPLADTSGGSLWPDGYKVQLRTGDAPADDPKVTTSKAAFVAAQGKRVLSLPGPLGVQVGAWVALAVVAVAVIVTRRK